MNIGNLLRRFEKLTIDNSPTILTALGVVGTLSTAYLTGKASVKAVLLLQEEYERVNQDDQELLPTNKEVVQLVWKLYLPAVGTGAVTIAAIVFANRVSSRRAAGMAAAYSISEKAFSEYKDKVVQRVGEKKEQGYRDELAQERVGKNPPNDSSVIITDNGEVLCYDHFTGRYFKSSMESIRQAENEINRIILNQGYASVSDLYELLGLPVTSFSDEVGWNSDRMLKIQFSTVMSTDNRPCLAIDFDLHPNRKFSHFAEG